MAASTSATGSNRGKLTCHTKSLIKWNKKPGLINYIVALKWPVQHNQNFKSSSKVGDKYDRLTSEHCILPDSKMRTFFLASLDFKEISAKRINLTDSSVITFFGVLGGELFHDKIFSLKFESKRVREGERVRFGQNLMSLETLDNESDESLRLALRETWWYRFGFAHLHFILGLDIWRMFVCLFVCFLEVLNTTFLKMRKLPQIGELSLLKIEGVVSLLALSKNIWW